MTLPVVWRDKAEADLLEILDYIAARNKPVAAASTQQSATPPIACPSTRPFTVPAASPAPARRWSTPITS